MTQAFHMLLLVVPLALAGAPPAVAPPAAAPPAVAAPADGSPQGLERSLLELDGSDGRAAGAAFDRLVELGEPAARAALEELLDDRPETVLGRKWRARLVARAGAAANLTGALAGLGHPDPAVRLELCSFLARPGFEERLDERVAALEALAIEDPSPPVRERAIAGLGELDEDPALRALNRMLDHVPSPERLAVARALARAWRARPFVFQRVRAGFAPVRNDVHRTPDDVLAALLPAYGTMLAEQPAGGETAVDRVPLVLGLRHPDPDVRAAAGSGFDGLVRRLRVLDDTARTLRILDAMDAEGFDRRVLLYERTLTLLRGRPDTGRAREAARELARLCGDSGDVEERDWRVSARYLEALAELAAGDCDAVAAPLADAGRLLDGLLAERVDVGRPELAAKALDWLHLRARVELFEAVRVTALAHRASARDVLAVDVLQNLRRMHALALEAQLFGQEHDLAARNDLGAALDDQLSPVALLIDTRGLKDWSVDERIAIVARVARGIRTVAPAEMPGFDPFEEAVGADGERVAFANAAHGRAPDTVEPTAMPGSEPFVKAVGADGGRVPLAGAAHGLALDGLRDPLTDTLRQSFYELCRAAYVGSLERELNKLYETFERSGEPDEQQMLRVRNLWRRIALSRQRKLSELRFPSTLALNVSELLREEGARPREARELVQRMRADLELDGALQGSFEGMEIAAEIDASIGASYMDEGAPRRAEIELEKAVERLEEFEQLGIERGFPPGIMASIRLRRSTTLVSLAVNANVKLDEPVRALEYFERAYELRQDDFMKVLLACYRARSKDADAARRILRDVPPTPDLFYNLACTYALLGDAEKALAFLRREFEENHVSDASRAKQQDWARKDPDLESLRNDPRFVAITGA